MNREYDVAIVGGGIAGSALGIALAREGVNVAIAERAKAADYEVRSIVEAFVLSELFQKR